MIALATMEDLERNTGKAEAFFDARIGRSRFDADHFKRMWGTLFERGLGVVIKRERGGEIQEAIGAVIYPDPHTGVSTAGITFWYLAEKPSGIVAGIAMMRLMIELKSRGISSVYLSASVNADVAKVAKFIQGIGFKPTELYFRMEI